MRIIKHIVLFCVFFWQQFLTKAQVGEKYYGRASYYADKFHGRMTSSGEYYSRDEYTCAHRNLPFNTILEVTNTINNKKVIVKVNDRGPFAYSRVLDLSFAAAKELELLANGEAEIQMKILSMDNPAYILPSFEPGERGDFNKEFRQHLPIKFEMKDGRMVLDTAYKAPVSTVAAPNVIASNQSANAAHKYIRVVKDSNGNYKLDSSGTTETAFIAPPKQQPLEVSTAVVNASSNPTNTSGHDYLNVYTDEEGRIRVRNTKNESIGKASANVKELKKSDAPTQVVATENKAVEKPKEASKDNSSKHSYLQVVKDADGRVRVETKSSNN
ncbi:septal ring lytic transglycosylase RlpA family protein [Flectobacillus sp. DC10W]|uniref:Probable endolytic peptidoglycan transglycosylase RlpA n=1 Tax=Flectobacillus longus TaxID=2984207 RepID=A0ABT6YUP8_9BACT|nr:septal ring lytic transglycosylase RlpA family protein [Flectobacillus longus]MDI9866861.1 septal ring lytic transglycosylase RlpA family protein [Flectobacillus longus]